MSIKKFIINIKLTEKIQKFPDYNCMIISVTKIWLIKIENNNDYQIIYTYFFDKPEYVDLKRGVDLQIWNYNFLTLIVYNQLFSKDKKYNQCVTKIYIMPFDKKRIYIYIYKFINKIRIN